MANNTSEFQSSDDSPTLRDNDQESRRLLGIVVSRKSFSPNAIVITPAAASTTAVDATFGIINCNPAGNCNLTLPIANQYGARKGGFFFIMNPSAFIVTLILQGGNAAVGPVNIAAGTCATVASDGVNTWGIK